MTVQNVEYFTVFSGGTALQLISFAPNTERFRGCKMKGVLGRAARYFFASDRSLAKIVLASAKLSFDPMSNQIPGTRQV